MPVSFGNVIWDEGQSLPYNTGSPSNDDQVNRLIDTSEDVYDFYSNLSAGAFLSWNGIDSIMHSIWKASFLSCPNASCVSTCPTGAMQRARAAPFGGLRAT